MPPRKTTVARRAGAMMPVSPSNRPHSEAGAIVKIDSPSENLDGKLPTADESAIMDDEEDDFDMEDGEAVEDAETGFESRPYKRVCRGRDSALSAAMNESTKKSDFSKPLVVRVGSVTNSQDFHIHAARLADSSPYFDDLLEKHRLEQQQQEAKEEGQGQVRQSKQKQQTQQDPDPPLLLPEDDPLVFQLYAHYIYDKSSISSLDLTSPTSDSRTAAYDTYIDLLHTYIFGEKIQNSDFQNEIMNRILQSIGSMHNNPSSTPSKTTTPTTLSSENIVRPLIELLYPSLPPDSIGRGLVVETFIVLWSHSDNLQNFVPDMSRELLTEIAEMLLSGDKDHIRDAWAQAIDGDYSYYHSARYDEH